MNFEIRATRFVSKHTNNTVEMIPLNANTKITGINTLNEFPTAGGMLSPNLICNFSICEILINNSQMISPMIVANVSRSDIQNPPLTCS